MKNNMKRVIFAVLIMVFFVQVVYGWNGGIKKIFAADDWEQISKSDIIGTWYSENYDEKDNWACSYKAKFVSKGNKVTVIGYRNKDIGTYKISKNKKKVVATFNKCYYGGAGEDYQKIKDYKYKVTYRLRSDGTLYVKYGKGADYTNATSGDWSK